jgi:hypothetical protein
VSGAAARLVESNWPESRVVRILATVGGVATVTLSVDGATTTTNATLLPNLPMAWTVPGGYCSVDFRATFTGLASASGSIGPGVALPWVQGDFVTLAAGAVVSLAAVPPFTQSLEIQVTAGTVQVGAGTFFAPPARILLVPSSTELLTAGGAGADLVRLYHCLG